MNTDLMMTLMFARRLYKAKVLGTETNSILLFSHAINLVVEKAEIATKESMWNRPENLAKFNKWLDNTKALQTTVNNLMTVLVEPTDQRLALLLDCVSNPDDVKPETPCQTCKDGICTNRCLR